MHISSYYVCSFCAVYMQFICNVFYETIKCYMQTTILHIHSTEVQPKAKSQVQPKPKSQQKPKAKSQVKPKPKAKLGMQIGSKLQQIARKSEILAPKCSKYKEPKTKSQKPKARSQKKMQRKKCPKKIALLWIVRFTPQGEKNMDFTALHLFLPLHALIYTYLVTHGSKFVAIFGIVIQLITCGATFFLVQPLFLDRVEAIPRSHLLCLIWGSA